MKHLISQIVFFVVLAEITWGRDALPKSLPIFQVVRFPNDACIGDSTRNGTCYTAEECSNRGGTNTGSCAEGYGVCCTFTVGCGSRVSENCTYFQATNLPDGPCTTEVCRCNDNVCQIRLDFQTFAITGPSTNTMTVGTATFGELLTANAAGATSVTTSSQCLTDTFSIGDQNTVPVICGTNTGEHVYFDASENCNKVNFQFGQTAIGQTKVTRNFDIKITQIRCNSEQMAPDGCTQYYFGAGPAHVRTFNFDSGNGRHLANQEQTICVRRENGNCAICWVADAETDVQLSGMAVGAKVKGEFCCAYGVAGIREDTHVGDCLMIPGALKATLVIASPVSQCGQGVGLVTATAANAAAGQKTVCSKSVPFRITFKSDNWEYHAIGTAAIDEGGATGNASMQKGFKIRYTQTSC